MSNTRDNGPELDYYELRRRHEEYKNRARTVQPSQKAADAVQPERPAPNLKPNAPAAEASARRKAPPVEELPAEELSTEQPIEEERSASVDPLARFVDEDEDEIYDEEELEPEEDEAANPNPFDSFIHFFHGVKDGIARRREAKEAELEDMDDLTDEELAALEGDEAAEDFDPPVQGAPAPEAAQPHDVEDDGVEFDSAARSDPAEADSLDAAEDEFGDSDAEEWEPEEEEGASGGGFKKFINLFVTRVDDA